MTKGLWIPAAARMTTNNETDLYRRGGTGDNPAD